MNQTKTTTSTLTPRQQSFVDAIVSSKSAAAAYRIAGFSAPNSGTAAAGASRMLKNVNVRAALAERRDRVQSQQDLDANVVLAGLRDIAMASDEPASARVSAWRAIADILGLVTRKVSIESERSETRNELQRMFTVSELLELRERMVASERKVLPEETVIDVDVVDVTVTEKG